MVSDIHGCVDQLNQLLEAVEFDSRTDQLILLGDYVDRGPNSKAAVEKVMELVQQDRAIALRGNHDQRLVDLIRKASPDVKAKFLEHGGAQTIQSYCHSGDEVTEEQLDKAIEWIRTQYGHHIAFLDSLPLYFEDSEHIYVHAGLNPDYPDWREQPEHDFMYIKNAFIQSSLKHDRHVIFGHTKTIDIHGTPDIWFGENKIGIDGGCAYGMQLNGLIYEDGEYRVVKVKNE
nr:metallophosphoesterase family protein [Paenibacillus soyae]